MVEFSELLFETWLQDLLQMYIVLFKYSNVRLPSYSQAFSLIKSFCIIIPLSIKTIMPEGIMTKNEQETWIFAVKRIAWVSILCTVFFYPNFAMIIQICIDDLKDHVYKWTLASTAFIFIWFTCMSFRRSGYGEQKCYMMCVLFLQHCIFWCWGFKYGIFEYDEKNMEKYVDWDFISNIVAIIQNIWYLMLFARASNFIKKIHGQIHFIQQNPDYRVSSDFELIVKVVIYIGLESNSRILNVYVLLLHIVCYLPLTVISTRAA